MKNSFEMTPEEIAKDEAIIAEIAARNKAMNDALAEAANDDGFMPMTGDKDARIIYKEDTQELRRAA